MRFKDLIGRKPEPEVSTGRLVTTPATPAPARAEPAASPPAPAAPDSLADIFGRLLAAEQGEPAPEPVPASAPLRLTDADVERIAARISDRLLEGPLGEDLRRIVRDVSERLIRDEIRRIRQAAESQQP